MGVADVVDAIAVEVEIAASVAVFDPRPLPAANGGQARRGALCRRKTRESRWTSSRLLASTHWRDQAVRRNEELSSLSPWEMTGAVDGSGMLNLRGRRRVCDWPRRLARVGRRGKRNLIDGGSLSLLAKGAGRHDSVRKSSDLSQAARATG